MAHPRVDGRFVYGFVASARELSPFLGRRVWSYLRWRGIDSANPDGWYPLDKFASAVADVESDLGEMTARDRGRAIADVIESLDGSESLAETMAVARTAHSAGHEDFSVERVGQWTDEPTADGGHRVATVGGWRHPEAFTRGIAEGLVENATDYELDGLERTTPRDREVVAFVATD